MKDVTDIFSTRIRELRGERKQEEIASKIGISRGSLSYYESGERRPDINILNSIADVYGVSTDYLLGRSDVKSTDIEDKAISDKLGLNSYSIEFLEHLNGKSKDDHISVANYNKLYKKTINVIIGGKNWIIEYLTSYLFFHFSHFGSWSSGETNSPISDLLLYDDKLDMTFSEDYDFISNVFLFQLNEELRQMRQEINELEDIDNYRG
ncbi:helix-turn-helix domain-containing protein [Ohessyouella blattaphilus]|uniref:Helix-turn-helix domain-containing protein n=1 Tax=Ohessyouella blattaphilus TaxID=2949333 RepID=A0ABT1EI01_9FIRM|nr:helix-turn-helix domain-containing protein [Ohessyouella blattaphilus]MCP1110332.1 helix-turn-helix domain-containing protein [Ohessyouella blattaphilus]MCR8563726.1 helix-turn-helix domain-containing protein [Ohessyouella blattaphilus]